MLYRSNKSAQVFGDDFCTTLVRMDEGDVCALVQEYCLGEGYVYHRVMFDGKVGYVHCRLVERVEE